MKVLHICLACFYPDNFSYQENMLPKFHKELGYDVEVIASLQTFNKEGKTAYYPCASEYINEFGIHVIRLDYKKPTKIYRKIRRYIGFEKALKQVNPDIIFVHGCQFMDMDVLVSYLRSIKKTVKVYVDNHGDFNNSAKNWFSRNILHKFLWRRTAKSINPFTKRFYGVLPARVKFLIDVYKLPLEKCELLVMGADDDLVNNALSPEIRSNKRQALGVDEKEILLMTGGKIDCNKLQVLTLMKAVNNLNDPRIKLVVFGSVDSKIRDEFDKQLGDRVQYIGWKKSEEIYSEFAAADIIAFPGLHSVLWEQAVGMGKPCIFKKIDGFNHVDLGGNCIYFTIETVDAYRDVIVRAINNMDNMKKIAEEKGRVFFSYKNIAKKALEV